MSVLQQAGLESASQATPIVSLVCNLDCLVVVNLLTLFSFPPALSKAVRYLNRRKLNPRRWLKAFTDTDSSRVACRRSAVTLNTIQTQASGATSLRKPSRR